MKAGLMILGITTFLVKQNNIIASYCKVLDASGNS
jgi:hypothetical protein